MSNYVNVNQTSNTVQLQNTDRQVIITGTPEQRDVTIVQPEVSVVTVSTIGPQGPRGERGQDGAGIETGSLATTGSNTFIGSQIISGTLNVTGGVTGSLFGTSSWSNYSVTASYITLAQTASYVLNAVSASYSTNTGTASSALTASYVNPLNQTVIITGSLIVSSSNTFTNIGLAVFSGSVVGTNGFTGSLQGTSSWSSNAVSASYIQYANITDRPTLLSSSAQIATDITGAFSSASGSLSSRITVTEGSLVSITAATASYILASQTSSMSVLSASLATTASYILYSNVSNKPTLISSSVQIATDISGAINATSSSLSSRITSVEASIVTLNAATASYILASQTGSMRVLSASFATTASYILNAVSSSFALTASYALNASTATVDTGSLLITASVSNATITFTKGNNSTFPITVNNVTNATSASYIQYSNITNLPTLLSSSTQIATDISGAFTSVSGGFSNRITIVESSIIALNAATSSYVLTSQTSSMQVLSASFATTASYALNATSIPAFPYTGTAIISGSLVVTGSVSSTVGFTGSIAGGNTASGTLILSSTTNPTKGKLLFGSSTYDEANNFLGIQQSSPTSKLQLNHDANSPNPSDANGLLLANATAAIDGTQSASPAIVLQGNGWRGVDPPGSRDVRFRIYVLPVQAGSTPNGTLVFQSSINGAAYVDRLTLTNGSMLSTSFIQATSVTSGAQVVGGGSSNVTQVYRTTNGGSNVSPAITTIIASTAGTLAMSFDNTNGFVLSAGNGTRHVARAAINITNLTNTTGSESGDLQFLTQTAGSAIAERMRIFAAGNVAIGTTTNSGFKFDVNGTSQFQSDVTVNGDLVFGTPTSPGYNGEVVRFGAGTLTAGLLYFLSSSGTWSLANASSAGTSTGMLGIAVGSSPTTNGLLIRGLAVSSSYAFGTGSIIYMATASGVMTATSPSSSNHVVRVMGYQTTIANTIYFDPDKTWVTLA